jgi:hypothetical protein
MQSQHVLQRASGILQVATTLDALAANNNKTKHTYIWKHDLKPKEDKSGQGHEANMF